MYCGQSGYFLNKPRVYIYIYIYVCVCVCVCVCDCVCVCVYSRVFNNIYIYCFLKTLSVILSLCRRLVESLHSKNAFK